MTQLKDLKEAEKIEVAQYFNGMGFDRWNRIYSQREDVNKVQRNIRIGHQKTVEDVLSWLKEDRNLSSKTFCDAGCGVGSISIPLANMGVQSIAASDISPAMVAETKRRALLAYPSTRKSGVIPLFKGIAYVPLPVGLAMFA